MLRLFQVGNALPLTFPVDPNAEFQPGYVAQLNTMGNIVVCGVSDGTAPLGIIDDIKTHAYTAPSIDEELVIAVDGVIQNSILVTPADIKLELENPNILEKSFDADLDVLLKARNGVITIPKGTALNCDLLGTGIPNAVKVTVSYTYQIPNVPGDDSTFATSRVTIWVSKIHAATDMYETNQSYPLNANLFVSECGLLTTRQVYDESPAIAMVVGPPTAMDRFLSFITYF